MPFIRGRYHINAIAGEALEAAREAEAALLALEHDAAQAGGASETRKTTATGIGVATGKGPIHRVEIEAAELVPSHSGRAQRGFVAHVHREAMQPEQGGRGDFASAASDLAASAIRFIAIAASGAGADGWECVASGNACVCRSS